MPALKKLRDLGVRSQNEVVDEVEAAVNCALQMGALAKSHEHSGPDVADFKKGRKLEREASLQMLRAWDHALRVSTGRGLKAFVQDSPGPVRLEAGERRWVADTEPSDEYTTPEGVPWKRVCRYNSRDGSRRFEVQRHKDSIAPVLTLSTDECAVNLAAFQFLAHRLQVRVVMLRDQAHRCWRDFKLAVSDAGLWPCVLELVHCMNCRHGPWTSMAWFRQCKEAMAMHLPKAGMGCPLFLALKDRLCMDMELGRAHEPGSQEELRACFENVKTADCIGRKGTRINMVRWFEFVNGYEEFQKNYWTHLFEYCLVLFYSGTVPQVAEMPIWEAHTVPMEWKELLKKKPPEERTARKTANSESKVAENTVKAKNSVHMAAMIMGRCGGFRRGRILLSVGRVVRKAFALELQAVASENLTFSFHLNHATQGHSLVFRRLWALLHSLPALEEMLFDFDGGMSQPYLDQVQIRCASSGSGAEAAPQVLNIHEMHKDEVQWSQLLWDLVVATIRHRGLSMAQFIDLPLGQMVALLSSKPAVVHNGLAKQKTNFMVLHAAEEKQFQVPGLAKVLDCLCWTQEAVVRELVMQLAEHDFRFVSPVVHKTLSSIYKGFANSVVVERGFQKLQDVSREQKDSNMSRVRRWYWLHQSKLLTELKKDEVSSEHQAVHEDVPRRLPKALFHALGGVSTIPGEKLEEITEPVKCKWAHCSAPGLQVQSGVWQLLCQCYQDDSWHLLQNSWHSALLQEGFIVLETATHSYYIVLKKCEYGALLWPATRCIRGPLVLFGPQTSEGTICRWRAVLDMAGWKGIPTQFLPPVVIASLRKAADQLIGIWLLQSRPAEPIEVVAAKWGFRGMADPLLDKLIRLRGMGALLRGKEALKGVLAKVEALIKNLIADVSKEDLTLYVKRRGAFAACATDYILLAGDNLQQSESIFESSDLKDAREFKQTHKAAVTVQCSTVQFLQQRGYLSLPQATQEIESAGGTAPRTVPQQRALPSKEVWSWSEVYLKTITPAAVGATIQQVTNQWNTCWTAKYRGAKPKASHTISYGGKSGVTCDMAARGCMIWLWNAHVVANPGESCPYEFTAMPLEGEAPTSSASSEAAPAKLRAKKA